jgi:hypothetical protein
VVEVGCELGDCDDPGGELGVVEFAFDLEGRVAPPCGPQVVVGWLEVFEQDTRETGRSTRSSGA